MPPDPTMTRAPASTSSSGRAPVPPSAGRGLDSVDSASLSSCRVGSLSATSTYSMSLTSRFSIPTTFTDRAQPSAQIEMRIAVSTNPTSSSDATSTRLRASRPPNTQAPTSVSQSVVLVTRPSVRSRCRIALRSTDGIDGTVPPGIAGFPRGSRTRVAAASGPPGADGVAVPQRPDPRRGRCRGYPVCGVRPLLREDRSLAGVDSTGQQPPQGARARKKKGPVLA